MSSHIKKCLSPCTVVAILHISELCKLQQGIQKILTLKLTLIKQKNINNNICLLYTSTDSISAVCMTLNIR